jgi:hypothetical protein
MATNLQEDILENVLSAIRTHEAADVLEEDRLNSLEQRFERFTVSRLGEKNQLRFM